jgi:hypothetical protein
MTKPTTFRTSVAHDTDQGLVLETRQDISDIIENNLQQRKLTDRRTRWGDDVFDNKIASIPMTVIDSLNHKGIMRGFHIVDQKRFKEFLNDPDNKVFRTREGRV